MCAARSKTGTGCWRITKLSPGVGDPCKGFSSESAIVAQCTHSTIPELNSSSVSVVPEPPLSSASVPRATCCICKDEFPRPVMFECPNPSAHLLCPACFENNVSSQFGEDIQAFVNRNCTVICTFCVCEAGNQKTEPFNMQALVPR